MIVYRYDGWKKGEPCPKCGSIVIARRYTYEDVVKSKDGKIWETAVERDDKTYLEILKDPVHEKWRCSECGTLLFESPHSE